jgi:hypothetical protein
LIGPWVLKVWFVVEKPLSLRVFEQVALTAAKERQEYF